MENELKKLIDDGQIIKIEKCREKRQKCQISIRLEKPNDAIHKNKHQMQIIDHSQDSVAIYISERKNLPGNYFFSKIDLKYAYSQIPLDEIIQKHCNFNILGGRATGTFINVFYVLTDIPATFQKT